MKPRSRPSEAYPERAHRATRPFRVHYFLPYDDPVAIAEHRSRRALLDAAKAGSVTAQVDLWHRYKLRLPLVEARTWWRPETEKRARTEEDT